MTKGTEKYPKLYPISDTIYNDRVNSVAGQLGDMIGKRVGGGRVQLGLTDFNQLASTLIKNENGFDKQAKQRWEYKSFALERIFKEYSWPKFDAAILIAVALACGSIDIEAGLNIETDPDKVHKECQIYGDPVDTTVKTVLAEAIEKTVGLATEYGNGNSIEFVVPFYTPGIWREIKDTEFGRKTGVIIVTQNLEIYCEGLDINGIQSLPERLLSVKTVEAIKIAKQLCREFNFE